jgi:hypothetical protein
MHTAGDAGLREIIVFAFASLVQVCRPEVEDDCIVNLTSDRDTDSADEEKSSLLILGVNGSITTHDLDDSCLSGIEVAEILTSPDKDSNARVGM